MGGYKTNYEGPFRTECENMMNKILQSDGHKSDVQCNCVPIQSAVVITNWDGENRGRRELICNLHEELGGCGFRSWIDQPICPRGRIVINNLLLSLERLAIESISMNKYNGSLEQENERLQESLSGFVNAEASE